MSAHQLEKLELENLVRPNRLITEFDDKFLQFCLDLIDTCVANNLEYVTAPHIGVHVSMMCIKIDDDDYQIFCNPKIISQEQEVLVIDDYKELHKNFKPANQRYETITIEYRDIYTTKQTKTFTGKLSHLIQRALPFAMRDGFFNMLPKLQKRILLKKIKRKFKKPKQELVHKRGFRTKRRPVYELDI